MTSRSVAEARIELPQPRLERSAGLRARSIPQTDETPLHPADRSQTGDHRACGTAGGLSVDSVDDPLRTRRSALRGALFARPSAADRKGARASEPAALGKPVARSLHPADRSQTVITVLAERLGGLSVDSVDDPLRTRRSALQGALLERPAAAGKERGPPSPQHTANRRHPLHPADRGQTGITVLAARRVD